MKAWRTMIDGRVLMQIMGESGMPPNSERVINDGVPVACVRSTGFTSACNGVGAKAPLSEC
ncbi:hypothetical protein M2421_002135 [Stenotrophomonas sp. BIGb0135]|nr:hypothetical protein [Stenotrophomonas sp. BIGb0135]